jgi:hypothetical protein
MLGIANTPAPLGADTFTLSACYSTRRARYIGEIGPVPAQPTDVTPLPGN